MSGALSGTSIYRLKRTWEVIIHAHCLWLRTATRDALLQHVSAKTITTLESDARLLSTDKNSQHYRQRLRTAEPPCIPFMGKIHTGLVFIEDGNSNFLADHPDLINFRKRMYKAEQILEIQQFQSVPYAFRPVPEIQQVAAGILGTDGRRRPAAGH